MKLLALLIGLIIERLATQLFHLRELRWLDRLIDAGFEAVVRFTHWPSLIPVTLLTVLLVLPVFLLRLALGDTLYGFPYLILAIFVLFFSLGPKDIGEDIDDYCRAVSGPRNSRRLPSAAALSGPVARSGRRRRPSAARPRRRANAGARAPNGGIDG